MKHLIAIAAALMLMTFSVEAKKGTSLTVQYEFKGIEEGYDHLSKAMLYIDGALVYTSEEHYQSKKQMFTIEVPKGSHDVKLMLMAKYEGVWEEHTVDNNYSIDCFVDETLGFSKKHKLTVIFDLDSDTSFDFK